MQRGGRPKQDLLFDRGAHSTQQMAFPCLQAGSFILEAERLTCASGEIKATVLATEAATQAPDPAGSES